MVGLGPTRHCPAVTPAFQQLAFLCGMQWQPPVYSNGMTTIPNVSTPEQIVEVQAKAVAHAERLAAQLQK